MKGQKKKQNGITLIALVISIIVMLILAGVSINALMGDNGILRQAQFASFMSEMAAVEEAVQLWGADHYDDENHSIPAKGIAQNSDVENSDRLSGEVGYYREWSRTNSMPTFSITSNTESFNNKFSVELTSYPAGVEDLYYLDNEGLNLNNNKKYLIDAQNSMVYSLQGITLNGIRCHSLAMAKAVMNGNFETPQFASAEVGGASAIGGKKAAGNTEPQYIDDGNGNLIENPNYNPYGFQIVGDYSNDNIYKLYNNGDLYGKGKKGFLLNSTKTEQDAINYLTFKELNISAEIPGASTGNIKIFPGYNVMFVIDSNEELWAWGDNPEGYNVLGLTQEEKVSYTGYNPIKLNVNNLKVTRVFTNEKNTFVVTKSNELYACGYNYNGELGIGNTTESIDTFTKVLDIDDANNIIDIANVNRDQYYTYMLKKDTTDENNIRNRLYATSSSLKKFGEVIPDLSSSIEKITTISNAGILFLSNNKIYEYNRNTGSLSEFKITNSEYTLNRCWFGFGSETLIFDITINSERQMWYYSRRGANILGVSDYETFSCNRLDNYFISGLTVSGIKEVYINSDNVFYLTNDKKIFATGNSVGLGVNNSTYVSGFVNLTSAVDLPDITQIICNNSNNNSGFANCIIFVGNGKNLITGNSQIMFGENVLQKNWKLIASGVKKFKADTTTNALGYIDNQGNLMVLGEDSRYLGLSIETSTPQYEFKMVTDVKDSSTGSIVKDRIKGKVEDFDFGSYALYIKTNEEDNNKLYAAGMLKINKWNKFTCLGLYVNYEESSKANAEVLTTGESNAYTPTKILDDVKYIDMSGLNRFAITNDDELYAWGFNDGDSLGIGRAYEPTIVDNDLLDIDKITKIKASTYQSYIIETLEDESGNINSKMFVTGINHVTGCTGTGASVFPFGEFDVDTLIDGETVKDIVTIDGTTTYIILTTNGNLYGWGYSDKLGRNKVEHSIIRTPVKIETISDVDQIIGCNGYFACIKKDGSVWATGSNTNGVMGRWIGIDRNTENSRYKTAYTWVECPELEI